MEEEKAPSSAQPSDDLGPLPAGRHGYSRAQVAHNQRERLIAGLAQAVAEHGYNAVTITHITTAAQVSRRAFYEHFADKEECFLAAFDILTTHLRELIAEASEPIPDWPHKVTAALGALLEFFASEPELARLCLLEPLAAGPTISRRYREVILEFVPYLRAGRTERGDQRALPESTEDSLIGALASLLGRSLAAGEAEQLPDLAPDLAEFLLTPYLGTELAHQLATPEP